MPVLKLKKHDEKREIDFEIKFQRSLSVKQRFELMFRKTKEIIFLLRRNGYRETSQIIKRS